MDGVQRFTFSGDGEYLAFLKGAPEGAEREVGQTLLVRDLALGTEMHFGNVGDFAWAGEGHLLAMVISASGGGLETGFISSIRRAETFTFWIRSPPSTWA